MQIFSKICSWWKSKRPLPMDQKLSVEFDDNEVHVKVLQRLEPGWNRSFKWVDIVKVCFKDEGIYNSDIIFIYLKGQDKPAIIFTEALGGTEFFGAIVSKGYFPENVWRSAIKETGGALHCWPEKSAMNE